MTTRILKAMRQALKASGKARQQICKETGLEQSQLSRLMAGKARLNLKTIEKLADDLDLEIIIRPRPTILDKPIETLLFSVRTHNLLTEHAPKPIRTIRQLVNCSERKLAAIPFLGQTVLTEIRQRLTEHGLNLKGVS